MPPTNQATEEVKSLLSQGRTEAAADYLLELSKDAKKQYHHSALLLKNRIENLQHQAIEGVLSQAEQNLEWARITKSILELTEQIEKNELPTPPELLFPGTARRKWPVLIRAALIFISLLAAAGWLVFQKNVDAHGQAVVAERPAKTIAYQGRVVRASDKSPVAGALLDFNHGELKAETDAAGNYEAALPKHYQDIYLEIYYQGQLKVNRRVIVSQEVLQELKIPD